MSLLKFKSIIEQLNEEQFNNFQQICNDFMKDFNSEDHLLIRFKIQDFLLRLQTIKMTKDDLQNHFLPFVIPKDTFLKQLNLHQKQIHNIRRLHYVMGCQASGIPAKMFNDAPLVRNVKTVTLRVNSFLAQRLGYKPKAKQPYYISQFDWYCCCCANVNQNYRQQCKDCGKNKTNSDIMIF